MLKTFTQYLRQEDLCAPGDRILLSVSGGPDSVLLAWLFREAGYAVGLAHCNYQLREDDAEADEAFVCQLALDWDVPFHVVTFDTRQRAAESGKSIQETARDLRYAWLEDQRIEHGYHWIATGHHLNDSIETLLINLAKGCGIRGLHGILPKRDKLIRPLLFARKREILAFLEERALPYRLDLSNDELYYERNKIRHGVIPVLETLNPSFETGAASTLQRLRDAEALYDFAVKTWYARIAQPFGRGLRISWTGLLMSPAPAAMLHEILAPFGFNAGQFGALFRQGALQSGRQWYAPGYRLLSDRDQLLLEPIEPRQDEAIEIPEGSSEVSVAEGTLRIERLPEPPAAFPEDPFEAFLDARALQFPLMLRRWRPGDAFRPLGMGGKQKKVQDFFTDLKLSLPQKENTWILDSNGQICWIIGRRIDENFKLQPDSKECWKLSFITNT
jgi:tRNA(Ile)-lysidine synthase